MILNTTVQGGGPKAVTSQATKKLTGDARLEFFRNSRRLKMRERVDQRARRA